MKLNTDQQAAANKFEDWWKSKSGEFTITGYAGTGKTYLINYLIENIIDKSFTITAPTHKALKVLEANTNKRGITVHSLLGLKPNMDLQTFDIERPQYDMLNVPKINNYKLVIVDECSMINTGLFLFIRKLAQRSNTKVLYVGDAFQLPPVGENLSPTFKNVAEYYTLKQIMRQEESHPLLNLFKFIRKDIIHNSNTFLNYVVGHREALVANESNTGNIGYTMVNNASYFSYLQEVYARDEFTRNIDHCRSLAYTNNAVKAINKFCRDRLIGEYTDLIVKQDVLTSYSTILDEFNTPIIINSEDYRVDHVKPYRTSDGIMTYAVNLIGISDKNPTPPFLIVDHTDPSFNKFLGILDVMVDKAAHGAKGGWYNYYKFKNKYLLMQSVYLKHSKKTINKDIDYAYGLTTHKSQGSTFENATIDLKDIVQRCMIKDTGQPDIMLRNKLIYVALSRAKNLVVIRY